jgi:alpha-L-fucosidase 2
MHKLNRRRFLRAGIASSALAFLARDGALAEAANGSVSGVVPVAGRQVLWFRKPAATWVDALPIGNGRLGAMVWGGGAQGNPAQELLQ